MNSGLDSISLCLSVCLSVSRPSLSTWPPASHLSLAYLSLSVSLSISLRRKKQPSEPLALSTWRQDGYMSLCGHSPSLAEQFPQQQYFVSLGDRDGSDGREKRLRERKIRTGRAMEDKQNKTRGQHESSVSDHNRKVSSTKDLLFLNVYLDPLSTVQNKE